MCANPTNSGPLSNDEKLANSFYRAQRSAQAILSELHNHDNPKLAGSAAVARVAADITEAANKISELAILGIGTIEFFRMGKEARVDVTPIPWGPDHPAYDEMGQ